MSQRTKNSLSVIFLLAFILIKAGGLHSLTHKDDLNKINDCVWCHLSITDSHTPILATDNFVDTSLVIVIQQFYKVDNLYQLTTNLKQPVCLIFNKPPPFFTV
ncbi:hypothetical protein [Zunongwangia sp.]|uniref:hypothetical protein n=1 Tax=Zunongwangia sp. TaxID=1965325 RepID=UPI003AA95EA0